MITLIVVVLTIFFVLGSVSSLLITDDVENVVVMEE